LTATPTIDIATFRDLEDSAGAEFVRELVDTFFEEAPAMIAELRAALAARDAEKFRRTAHSLKSNSNTFGALGLGAMARELELGGLPASVESGSERIGALEREYSLVVAALKELRRA